MKWLTRWSRMALTGWLGLISIVASAAPAEKAPAKCEICQDGFKDSPVYVAEDPIRQVKKHICLKCTKSKTVCSICGLAANPKTLRKLDDGRILCELDLKEAVLSETEAREIFHDVKRSVQQILGHWSPLPDTNITVFLVSQVDFIKEYQRKPAMDAPEKLLGLTRSNSADGTNHVHQIYLLSGTQRSQFRATCAHEYAHTWLNEHFNPARTLNKDTEEGFCELIAWKYVSARGEKMEIKRILENPYTRGQVNSLIAAEERYQFHRVINWILQGVDSWLDQDKIERLLVLKEDIAPENPPIPLWQHTTVRTPVPDTLTLRGISVSGSRRFALINDRTLQPGESARVRVGSSNTLVHCLEIRETSVLLRVAEKQSPIELSIPPAPDRK